MSRKQTTIGTSKSIIPHTEHARKPTSKRNSRKPSYRLTPKKPYRPTPEELFSDVTQYGFPTYEFPEGEEIRDREIWKQNHTRQIREKSERRRVYDQQFN